MPSQARQRLNNNLLDDINHERTSYGKLRNYINKIGQIIRGNKVINYAKKLCLLVTVGGAAWFTIEAVKGNKEKMMHAFIITLIPFIPFAGLWGLSNSMTKKMGIELINIKASGDTNLSEKHRSDILENSNRILHEL